jgi:HlyD family secretion protein
VSHSTGLLPRKRVSFRTLSLILASLFLVVSTAWAWGYVRENLMHSSASDADKPVAATVRRVHALGRLEPRGTLLSISAPSGNEGARVEKLMVEEGQDVQAGELLAILDVAERRQAAVNEAEARWNVTKAGLDQIRAGQKPGDIAAQAAMVQKMDAELKVARKELDRARNLTSKNAMAVESLDQKQLAFDRAEIECQRARALLESLREVREVDVRLQEMEVAASAAALARAKSELDAARVYSRQAGRVLKIHTHPGEKIRDAGILQMGDVSQMQAIAEVFEGDLPQILIGQRAVIRLTSTGQEIAGSVFQIGRMVARKDVLSNDPVSDTDARVLEVRLNLDPQQRQQVERLANARIEVDIDLGGAGTAECRPVSVPQVTMD